VQSPKFDLEEVKQLAREWMGGKHCGWFSAATCSVDYVIHVFECTQVEAEAIILDGILKLESGDFSRRIAMWGSVADEYGLESYLGYNWYIKFMVEDGELDQISFHPCEQDMSLANGRTITVSIVYDDLPSWRK
jgi:hypothetical protein